MNRVRRLKSAFYVAFSMYSAIPMPRTTWNAANLKYALCFFPLVGAVVGGIWFLWLKICLLANFSAPFYAGGALALTACLTGGIHLDGYCDVMDALGSRQTRERKLEILKDPHTGAFAVIGFGMFLVLAFGLHCEFYAKPQAAPILAMGFVLSRAVSGLGVVKLCSARKGGLAATFSDAADKTCVASVMCGYIVVCGTLMMLWRPITAWVVLGACTLAAYGCQTIAKKQFGGVTGDVAGWFLVICETAFVAAVFIGG